MIHFILAVAKCISTRKQVIVYFAEEACLRDLAGFVH